MEASKIIQRVFVDKLYSTNIRGEQMQGGKKFIPLKTESLPIKDKPISEGINFVEAYIKKYVSSFKVILNSYLVAEVKNDSLTLSIGLSHES